MKIYRPVYIYFKYEKIDTTHYQFKQIENDLNNRSGKKSTSILLKRYFCMKLQIRIQQATNHLIYCINVTQSSPHQGVKINHLLFFK